MTLSFRECQLETQTLPMVWKQASILGFMFKALPIQSTFLSGCLGLSSPSPFLWFGDCHACPSPVRCPPSKAFFILYTSCPVPHSLGSAFSQSPWKPVLASFLRMAMIVCLKVRGFELGLIFFGCFEVLQSQKAMACSALGSWPGLNLHKTMICPEGFLGGTPLLMTAKSNAHKHIRSLFLCITLNSS